MPVEKHRSEDLTILKMVCGCGGNMKNIHKQPWICGKFIYKCRDCGKIEKSKHRYPKVKEKGEWV